MTSACTIRVRGVVQGVGFRPFVYRLARANTLAGWVLNGDEGVEIHLEGDRERVDAFLRELRTDAPAAASITAIDVDAAEPSGLDEFVIRASQGRDQPTVAISSDLAVCACCLRELFDPADQRYQYPYINCTDCGPRYSIILRLPYDRAATTMGAWTMDARCAGDYHDPGSRRFHAQPVACPSCGPGYRLVISQAPVPGITPSSGVTLSGAKGAFPEAWPRRSADIGSPAEAGVEPSTAAITHAARLLRGGSILAIKGLGGYHLACDARNPAAVAALRDRKFRKEKPFALMARDLAEARALVELTPEAEALLASAAAPIVLAPGRVTLPHVAPDTDELGVMLPYTPLHHLLFAAGAPDLLVMTSANRSSEPIAYEDEDARERLAGLADGLLAGERPIARRVEDSVVRCGRLGAVILRRSRGYAPGAVAALPVSRPVLALGADLKNAITLVVGGQAFVSQHIGDLEHYDACRALEATIHDLLAMYAVSAGELLVVRDAHPQYRSSAIAAAVGAEVAVVQHHRAHVASVLAERGAWDQRVLGISLDGTGYGDDGTIWGGELFAGSIRAGFERVAHLRPAKLAGGDAAARQPVQAAAGFLDQLEGLPDLARGPFEFPAPYEASRRLLETGTRVFATTSAGRLFDAAAALVGFTRPVTFEGQAAMWLEQRARASQPVEPYPCPFDGAVLDWRPLLRAVVNDRLGGRDRNEIARAFHRGLAGGLCNAAVVLCATRRLDTVAMSGGVVQNAVLLDELAGLLEQKRLALWINHRVPPNDGGISLGQAALGALGSCTSSRSR